MNRQAVIQAIADSVGARTYLEIGVQSGDTFFPLRIRKKIAVDPRFEFKRWARFNWMRWNWCNIFNEYYPMKSDAFFAEQRKLLQDRTLDVVFVDGLHTYEQSLRDIENSLPHLNEHGVIVVDDCNPQSRAAASPVKAPTQFIWNGDVWKAIAFLRATRPGLNIFTLDCVYGLAIITRDCAKSRYDCDPAKINLMTYEDFDNDRAQILDLKPVGYVQELLPSLRSAAATQRTEKQRSHEPVDGATHK